jgi:integrase
MPDLSTKEMKTLAGTSTHAFRQTFGRLAVAEGVPLDVPQRILGDASLQTTSIYVQAERKRMLREASGFGKAKKRKATFPRQLATFSYRAQHQSLGT